MYTRYYDNKKKCNEQVTMVGDQFLLSFVYAKHGSKPMRNHKTNFFPLK